MCKFDFFSLLDFTHLLFLQTCLVNPIASTPKNRVDFNFFEYPIYREESHNECYTCFVRIRFYYCVYKRNINRGFLENF